MMEKNYSVSTVLLNLINFQYKYSRTSIIQTSNIQNVDYPDSVPRVHPLVLSAMAKSILEQLQRTCTCAASVYAPITLYPSPLYKINVTPPFLPCSIV